MASYNIDVESMLWLPCHVYWKSTDTTILGFNDANAEYFNLKSRHEAANKKLEEIDPGQPEFIVQSLYKIDMEILKSGQAATKIEVCSRPPHYQAELFLTYKMPLLDNTRKITGLFGFSFKLKDFLNDELQLPFINVDRLVQQYSLQESTIIEGEALTSRQSQCLFYLSCGLSYKQIGKRLAISARTVEDHITRLKEKFLCDSREELIQKILPIAK